jgi:hypothetical protein
MYPVNKMVKFDQEADIFLSGELLSECLQSHDSAVDLKNKVYCMLIERVRSSHLEGIRVCLDIDTDSYLCELPLLFGEETLDSYMDLVYTSDLPLYFSDVSCPDEIAGFADPVEGDTWESINAPVPDDLSMDDIWGVVSCSSEWVGENILLKEVEPEVDPEPVFKECPSDALVPHLVRILVDLGAFAHYLDSCLGVPNLTLFTDLLKNGEPRVQIKSKSPREDSINRSSPPAVVTLSRLAVMIRSCRVFCSNWWVRFRAGLITFFW